MAGSTNDSVGAQTDWYLFTTDSLGTILSEKRWGAHDSSEYAVCIMSADDEIYLLGNSTYQYQFPAGAGERSNIVWQKEDSQGNSLSSGADNAFMTAASAAEPFGNDQLVLGTNYIYLNGAFFPQPYWFYLDASGNKTWSQSLTPGQYGEAVAAANIGNQEAVIAARVVFSDNRSDILLYKTSLSGNIVAEKRLELPSDEKPIALKASQTGALMLIAQTGSSFFDQDIVVARLNPETLDTLWYRRLALPGAQEAHASLVVPNGNIAIAGAQTPDGSASRDAFLAMSDSLGNLLWFKTYGGLKGDIFWDIQPAGDGNGFVIAGQTASFGPGGDLQAWLVKTDSLGRIWSNRVIGKVARDAVQNCVIDAGEIQLSQWLVTASSAQGSLYTLTDSLGNYEISVDTGAWFVSVLPSSAYWLSCEDSVELQFNQSGETQEIDFPVQVLYECALLDVDVSTPYLRRCFENIYHVRYYNYGTTTAPDAVVSIFPDPYLSVTGSSIPYTQSGDTLFFSVGEVPWLNGGSFTFSALLDCDSTVLGQMHCTEAHIYPDSICSSFDPNWDGSHLEVDGYCAGDSVVLFVRNTGLGMQDPVSYIITEDQIIFKLSSLQLAASQDTMFVLHPNGATVTIIVTQSPGHPGNSKPMLVIEGCGDTPFSTGYAFQFPQNDGDPSTDIECRASIGSFDPNDKTGLPLGVGETGVIAPDTKIEYLIRFQNTGTDTAFRVEIVDTLSAQLDLATFRPGAASHSYRLEISGAGVLHFIFDPIALPDSLRNYDASQGFVKFSIYPKNGILPGTPIENDAAIYFDHNSPVLTNTTLHTIDDPKAYLSTKTTDPVNAQSFENGLSVSPNPGHDKILVNLLRPSNSGGLQIEICNMLGITQLQTIYWPQPDTTPLQMNLGTLSGGIYFIIAKDERGKPVFQSRIIKI